MRLLLAPIILGFSLPVLASAALAPSAAGVSAEIDRAGAKQAIANLTRNGQWDAVVDRIGTGRADWVSIAVRLAPGSDAGSSEDLAIGLAYALPHNPALVLAAIGPDPDGILGVHRVCGVPFIEMPKPSIAKYVRRAQAAVGSVSTPRLRAHRDACLAELKS